MAPDPWRTPEELVEIGFARSRVVMMNEAHSGLRRSIRARAIGERVLPAAHRAGCRHLAMEALRPDFAAEANAGRAVPAEELGYLSQPEMRSFIAAALDLGWTLVAYEADLTRKPAELENLSLAETNWRENEQARNLLEAVMGLPGDAPLFVWCGNHHLWKERVGSEDEWSPMGIRFWERSGIEPFAIDQIQGVNLDPGDPDRKWNWTGTFDESLLKLGGTAGFLVAEAPSGVPSYRGVDAILLSTDNEVV